MPISAAIMRVRSVRYCLPAAAYIPASARSTSIGSSPAGRMNALPSKQPARQETGSSVVCGRSDFTPNVREAAFPYLPHISADVSESAVLNDAAAVLSDESAFFAEARAFSPATEA